MSKIVESFLTALGSDLSDAQRAIRRYGIGSRSSAPRHIAAAFSPISLSPSLWLKSDAGLFQDTGKTTPAASDDDPVRTWADQSGNGRDVASVNDARRGLLKLNVQNSLPSIRLDGTDDYYVAGGAASVWNFLHDGTGGTVVAVVNQTADADCVLAATGAWTGTDRGFLMYRAASSDRPELYIANGSAMILNGLSASGSPWIHNTPMALAATYEDAATAGALWKNGTVLSSAADTGTPSVSDAAAVLTIGSRAGTASTYFTGDLFEILVFDYVLSAPQMAQVFSYLNGRWALF